MTTSLVTSMNTSAAEAPRPNPHDYVMHVDLSQPWELSYWCRRFGVSAERLQEAVQCVGTDVDQIRAHLTDDHGHLFATPALDLVRQLDSHVPQDRGHIDIYELWDLIYWCRTFRVTSPELIAAVKAAGTSVEAVARALNRAPTTTPPVT